MEIKQIASIFPDEYSVEITLESGDVHLLGPFTDDKVAIQAVKDFELREFGADGSQAQVPKAKSPFDYINAFYAGFNPFDKMNLGEFEFQSKKYSQFMINRGMSMSEENALAAAEVDRYPSMSNYAHAAYWANKADKPRQFAKWIKESAKDKKRLKRIDEIAEELSVSKLRAEEYLEVLEVINN